MSKIICWIQWGQLGHRIYISLNEQMVIYTIYSFLKHPLLFVFLNSANKNFDVTESLTEFARLFYKIVEIRNIAV